MQDDWGRAEADVSDIGSENSKNLFCVFISILSYMPNAPFVISCDSRSINDLEQHHKVSIAAHLQGLESPRLR